ncbi:hypothetical protein [Winogradskyella forsetii]|uniref:hypothetical protein n=1 Tax=Winogradskyella forsetii TaxID=2686077 RepID=UPI0015B7BFF1|nr:hypothetical protein [Winogradskyella forsetii]
MKTFKKISDFFSAIIIIPFAIILMVIIIPFAIAIIIISQVDRLKEKRQLQDLIEANNGKIYFLYSDYNNYDFTSYFKQKFRDIECVKIKAKWNNNPLINHLTRDCGTHSYPRIVRITNNELLVKEHFSSFKNLYKRKNDINSFFELIKRSIKNIKNENQNTRKTHSNRERPKHRNTICGRIRK